MRLERGTLVLLNLDPVHGHEQRGMRPCVVASDPELAAHQRFPLICVIPVTGTRGRGALYPALAPGGSGLTKPSWALVDQLRSVDKRRVLRLFGRVRPDELSAIEDGLALLLGISERLQH